MNDEIHVDEKLIEAFHLMFDHFPEAAQLTHKSKQVVALNPACKAIGREVGMICARHGPPEGHKGCLAHKAVNNHKAFWKKRPRVSPDGQEAVIFWLPVDGYPDFYIHYAVGLKNTYALPPE